MELNLRSGCFDGGEGWGGGMGGESLPLAEKPPRSQCSARTCELAVGPQPSVRPKASTRAFLCGAGFCGELGRATNRSRPLSFGGWDGRGWVPGGQGRGGKYKTGTPVPFPKVGPEPEQAPQDITHHGLSQTHLPPSTAPSTSPVHTPHSPTKNGCVSPHLRIKAKAVHCPGGGLALCLLSRNYI